MTNLSPAAQAILAAAQHYEINPECYSRQIAAAALRAAADLAVPAFISPPKTRTGCVKLGIRNRLQSIADELEGRDATSI
jgi:hypothetical protein